MPVPYDDDKEVPPDTLHRFGWHATDRDLVGDTLVPSIKAQEGHDHAKSPYQMRGEIAGKPRGAWAFYRPDSDTSERISAQDFEGDFDASAPVNALWARKSNAVEKSLWRSRYGGDGEDPGRRRVHRVEAQGQMLRTGEDPEVFEGEHVAESLKVHDTEWTPPPGAADYDDQEGPRGNWLSLADREYDSEENRWYLKQHHGVQGTLPPHNWDRWGRENSVYAMDKYKGYREHPHGSDEEYDFTSPLQEQQFNVALPGMEHL